MKDIRRMTEADEEETALDLSGWNEVESYALTKAAGINHVILKAVNKSLHPDKKFEQHLKGCADADIKVIGTYHYSYAITVEMARQAARAWIRIENGRCRLFILDWEDAVLPKSSRAAEIINAYADEIQGAGYEFAVYTGLSWYNSYLRKYADKLPYEFWIARYYAGYKTFATSDPVNTKYIPVIKHQLIGWQYTSSGRVPGVKGSVDINQWYKAIPDTHPDKTMPADCNPFSEPVQNIRIGSSGEGAKWVQWYLWRFGLLLTNGAPDKAKVTGYINEESQRAIQESQRRLGLTGRNVDGIVGQITRALYRKVC